MGERFDFKLAQNLTISRIQLMTQVYMMYGDATMTQSARHQDLQDGAGTAPPPTCSNRFEPLEPGTCTK